MRFTILCSFLLLASCSGDSTATSLAKNDKSLNHLHNYLLGTWEMTDMKVSSPSHLGIADSLFEQHIGEADWAKVYGVKPARTIYTADGKFKRIHFFKDGTQTDIVHGLWKIKGDSLLVIEPNVTLDYLITKGDDQLNFKGLVDYDRDGSADDQYEANFRLVARTN